MQVMVCAFPARDYFDLVRLFLATCGFIGRLLHVSCCLGAQTAKNNAIFHPTELINRVKINEANYLPLFHQNEVQSMPGFEFSFTASVYSTRQSFSGVLFWAGDEIELGWLCGLCRPPTATIHTWGLLVWQNKSVTPNLLIWFAYFTEKKKLIKPSYFVP